MEKIQLTQEQAEVVEVRRNRKDKSSAIEHHVKIGWAGQKYRFLNDFTVDEFCRLLYVPGSYEVIPRFKVGDWVVLKSTGEIYQIRELSNIYNCDFVLDNNLLVTVELIRHATPEEIQQEKKRRFWDKLGRDVDVYKSGDIVTSGTGDYTAITNLEIKMNSVCFESIEAEYGAEYSFDEIRLVTPVEQRLDK